MRMMAKEARGTAVFTRGVEVGRNLDTPRRRKPDKGGEAERWGLGDRQQARLWERKRKGKKGNKERKKNKVRKREQASSGGWPPAPAELAGAKPTAL